VTVTFGDPAGAPVWAGEITEVAGKRPRITVNGLAVPVVLVSAAIADPDLIATAQLQGVVHLNDTVTITGDAGWLTDASSDSTGAMSAESVTNNSKARHAGTLEF
jgi:hypothetical protein